MTCYYSKAQWIEKRLLFFPGKDSANAKPWTVFTTVFSTSLSLFKESTFPYNQYKEFHMAQHGCNPEMQFLADPEQTCFC